MRHIYRQKNSGRYYVRIQFPKAFKRTHPHLVPKSAEIRLSLYSTNHAHALELAKASWLAAREVIRSPHLTALGIKTFNDLKNHIRASVATHLPKQYTSLIELTGSAATQSLHAAIKLLIAYNTAFYILPPKMGGIIHKYKQPSPRYPKGSYEAVSKVTGQTFPPMRITNGCINDVINNNREIFQPDWLYYEIQGEKLCLKTEEAFTITISHLFVSTNLPANVIASIRRLSEIRLATSTTDEHRKPPLLSEEIQNYIKFKKTTWTPKTQGECETQLRIFNELLTDKALLQLTSKDYDFYIQNIPRWPANSSKNKLYKGKTAREIAMMPDPEKVIGPDRIESYHKTITGFIRWAADRDENKGMNTSILRMKPQTNQVKGDGYVAFPPEHLSKIFESDLAMSFLDQTKHPYQKWIPVLGLFLGSRLDELCSLQTNQVGTENGIHYIEIRKGKTENAARRVPLASVLVDTLGFLRFCEYKKSIGEKRLFSECTYVHKHGHKKAASRWFGEFLDHLGITDKKYVFHSFRHNVSNVLNEVDTLKSWRISRYLGHAIPTGASESERSYFKQRRMEHLLPVVEALKYNIDWTRYAQLCRQTYK